ncbi:GNAT family N-acetyltransferase [Streptomyces sp. NPDC005727]|uniref:GNAT family N-acetyltransferase n=1 Tax=Streptomyces sp. NPDC005727 TaxID=3157053 RepID=UPI0033FE9234
MTPEAVPRRCGFPSGDAAGPLTGAVPNDPLRGERPPLHGVGGPPLVRLPPLLPLVEPVLALDAPGTDEGRLEQVAVRRDHRGRDIARLLLRHTFRAFHRTGLRSCTLWTHSDTGALDLYPAGRHDGPAQLHGLPQGPRRT